MLARKIESEVMAHKLVQLTRVLKGDWSRGMILPLGGRGPGFNSLIAPFFSLLAEDLELANNGWPQSYSLHHIFSRHEMFYEDSKPHVVSSPSADSDWTTGLNNLFTLKILHCCWNSCSVVSGDIAQHTRNTGSFCNIHNQVHKQISAGTVSCSGIRPLLLNNFSRY